MQPPKGNAADSRLIRQGVWVRRRRDGTSPMFESPPCGPLPAGSAVVTAGGCKAARKKTLLSSEQSGNQAPATALLRGLLHGLLT